MESNAKLPLAAEAIVVLFSRDCMPGRKYNARWDDSRTDCDNDLVPRAKPRATIRPLLPTYRVSPNTKELEMIRATRKKSATMDGLSKTRSSLSRGGAIAALAPKCVVPRRKQKRAAGERSSEHDMGSAGSDANNGVAGEDADAVRKSSAGRPKRQRVAYDLGCDVESSTVRGTQSNGTVGDCCIGAETASARRSKSKLGSCDDHIDSELTDAAPSKSKRAAGVRPDGTEGLCARSATTKGAEGDSSAAAEHDCARRPRKSRRAISTLAPTRAMPGGGSGGDLPVDSEDGDASICRQLQEAERRYVALERSRIMIDNRLRACVAQFLGYNARMEEAERKAYFTSAEAIIKSIINGTPCPVEHVHVVDMVRVLVISTGIASDGYQKELDNAEKEMVKLAKSLPVWSWAEGVRGFGAKSLARIIGESGDLNLYANPAKLWKRFGLAPFKGKMCSTWRRKGGLHAAEWSEIGYNPRRRSVVWNVGECLVKQNQGGAYRKKYDAEKAKKVALASEDWKLIRCHNHGKLMAEKLLILDLWKAWRGIGDRRIDADSRSAEPVALPV